jgi:hypothetical protein
MVKQFLARFFADAIGRNAALVTIAAGLVAVFVANPPPPPSVFIKPAMASVIGNWPSSPAAVPGNSGNPGFSPPTAIEPLPQRPALTPSAPVEKFIR